MVKYTLPIHPDVTDTNTTVTGVSTNVKLIQSQQEFVLITIRTDQLTLQSIVLATSNTVTDTLLDHQCMVTDAIEI
jgi:hypothetical protein